MKFEIVRARLDGLENRLDQRRLERRLKVADYIERKRMGRVRQYETRKWKRA